MGYRNPFDIAFNRDGDLFTYDSDMEWDMNTPWYRPTRVCHAVQRQRLRLAQRLRQVADLLPRQPAAGRQHRPRLADRRRLRLRGEVPGEVPGRPLHLRLELRQALRRHLKPERLDVHGRVRGVRHRHAAAADRRRRQPEGRGDVLRHRRPQDDVGALSRHLRRQRVDGAGDGGVRRMGRPSERCGTSSRPPRQAEGRRRSTSPGRTWPVRTASSAGRPGGSSSRIRPAIARGPWPRSNRVAAFEAILALIRTGKNDDSELATDRSSIGCTDSLRKALDEAAELDLLRLYQLVPPPRPAVGRGTQAGDRARRRADPGFHVEVDHAGGAEAARATCRPRRPRRRASASCCKAPTQEEQIEYALSLRALKAGWTPELREEYFAWFPKAAGYRAATASPASSTTSRPTRRQPRRRTRRRRSSRSSKRRRSSTIRGRTRSRGRSSRNGRSTICCRSSRRGCTTATSTAAGRCSARRSASPATASTRKGARSART